MISFPFIETINKLSNDSIRMSLFSKIKTNNIFLDTIISTIILTFISYLTKLLYETTSCNNSFLNLQEIDIYSNLKYVFLKKNVIKLNGKKCSSLNWNCASVVSSTFGDSFNAVWCNIINNIENNETIYEIKDFLTIINNENKNIENNKNEVFIVSQKKPFVFNKDLKIFATTNIYSEETKSEKDKSTSKIENIEIILYSYECSLSKMKKYIDTITEEYLNNIEKNRNNKQYIYTLVKTKFEESKSECWKESIFKTTRNFDNMFFEQKNDVIEKLKFFLNNTEWYYKKGIPYTLGFGLHGPPGTGKTSFIKSLAEFTNRHIIILSLKLIKTRRQLQEFFYEEKYNENNKKKNIGFDKKIIVIEDIDAQGDIVLDRSKKKNIPKINYDNITEKTNVGELIKTIMDNEKLNEKSLVSTVMMKPNDDEPITLDDILNLWDGLEETVGRILVISSNHYGDLDPAITRPGRIDISIEMRDASHKIIEEMYEHLYEKPIDANLLNKVTPYFYSPAEIINLYLMHKNDETAFIERLLLNEKIK